MITLSFPLRNMLAAAETIFSVKGMILFFRRVFLCLKGMFLRSWGMILCLNGMVLFFGRVFLCLKGMFLRLRGMVVCLKGVFLCFRPMFLCLYGVFICSWPVIVRLKGMILRLRGIVLCVLGIAGQLIWIWRLPISLVFVLLVGILICSASLVKNGCLVYWI
jgi:hypothetical protein